MSSALFVPVFVFACILSCDAKDYSRDRKVQPPEISTDFDHLIYFYSTAKEFTCLATGVPPPTYTWYFNNEEFNGKYDKETGVLEIAKNELNDGHKGRYHCEASNQHGTAISNEIALVKAENRVWVDKPKVTITGFVTDHVVLSCSNQPICVPKAKYRWHVGSSGIIETKRLAVDQDGNLHIINAVLSDDVKNYNTSTFNYYRCSSENTFLSTQNYGSKTHLTIIKRTGTPQVRRAPDITFNTKSPVRVLMEPRQGEMGEQLGQLELQCVPDGMPIPSIIWKKDGKVLTHGKKIYIDSFTRRLAIMTVEETDQGIYECVTSLSPFISREIKVEIISRPIWIEQPESLTVVEGFNIKLQCDARSANDIGFVSTRWYKNTIPLNDGYDANKTVLVEGKRLTIKDVRKPDDVMTIQCNASNRYGYTLKNVAINVIKKTVITTNMVDKKLMKKGEKIEMTITAVPDPLVLNEMRFEWRFDSEVITNIDRSKFVYLIGHDLVIVTTNDTSEKDFQGLMGDYTCNVIVGVESANMVIKMQLFTTNPVLPSVVKKSPFPLWIIGLVCGSIFLIVIIIIIIFFMYRNRGDVWKDVY